MPQNRAVLPYNGASMKTEILSTNGSRLCDRFAVENGVTSQSLMNKAGQAIAAAIRDRWAARPTLVLAGPGNNGGDGLIAAAELRKAGWPVRVVLFADPDELSGDAAWALTVWGTKVDLPTSVVPTDSGLVVDALFGAGLSRPVEGVTAQWLERIEQWQVPVVAADLPSGVGGDARPLDGPAVKADLTVTFHRRKPAHLIEPFTGWCGEIVCADIGIPDGWDAVAKPVAHEVRPPDWPAARRPNETVHKHQRGRVAVFSGGATSTGAARLAARASLRAGTGLVTVCSPPSAALVNASQLSAVMLARWEGGDDTARLLGALRCQAAVLGPAMGVGAATRKAVLSALSTGIPLVLDADALTSFEADPDRLFEALHGKCVLTPHGGEHARLFGKEGQSGSKLDLAVSAADRAGCTVLLKGAASIIAAPDEMPVINRHSGAALATAGSGDVLAGIIAAGLAAGLSPHHAAAGAAWLHGDAGLRLGAGLVAEDLPEALPSVLQALRRRFSREAMHAHLLAHGN